MIMFKSLIKKNGYGVKKMENKIKKTIELTQTAKKILELAKADGFEFIARDEDGVVWFYHEKPYHEDGYWNSAWKQEATSFLKSLFPFISSGDREATSISCVLEKCVVIEDEA